MKWKKRKFGENFPTVKTSSRLFANRVSDKKHTASVVQHRKWIFFWKNLRKSIIKNSFEFSSVFLILFSHFSYFYVSTPHRLWKFNFIEFICAIKLKLREEKIFNRVKLHSRWDWMKWRKFSSAEHFFVLFCVQIFDWWKIYRKSSEFPTETRKKVNLWNFPIKNRNRETVRYRNYPHFDFGYKKRNLLSLQVIDIDQNSTRYP